MSYSLKPKLLFIFLVTLSISGWTQTEFPIRPEPRLTVGSLCSTPIELRYPEQIPYCDRDELTTHQKVGVMARYRRAGYRLPLEQRQDYKIDHYIPLCAGGSNRDDNLWPQHLSIAEITDPIEELACQKLAAGRISQRDLVRFIMAVKNNLSSASRVSNELERL
ncbi:MAG TPA: hypothetical protein VNJ01_14270 [Bacteriovoracaceae bacterium]|nr:hypothetical protein [Bacteriovoracaceae bacterium]